MTWEVVRRSTGRTDRVTVSKKRVVLSRSLSALIGSPSRVDLLVDRDEGLVKVVANSTEGAFRLNPNDTGSVAFSSMSLYRMLGVEIVETQHWPVVDRDAQSFVVRAS